VEALKQKKWEDSHNQVFFPFAVSPRWPTIPRYSTSVARVRLCATGGTTTPQDGEYQWECSGYHQTCGCVQSAIES
jgi:hypothetical protein